MYTVQILNVTADKNFPNISVSTVQFFKDGQPITVPTDYRGFTTEQLREFCYTEKKRYENIDRVAQEKIDADNAQAQGMADLIANPPQSIDLSDPTPTKDQLFQKALAKAREIKVAIDCGIKPVDDPEFVQAVRDAKAADLLPNASMEAII